jgi:deoxyribodipyrimidine photolyase-related protein
MLQRSATNGLSVVRRGVRNLVLVLGDQLTQQSAAFEGFDARRDAVWMAEVAEESTHVWSHKARIALFLSAMRHFRDALRKKGISVHYRQLDDRGNRGSFAAELTEAVRRLKPRKLRLVRPGEWRVSQCLTNVARQANVELEMLPDRHFFATVEDFRAHSQGRRQLRSEFFYRELRRKHGILTEDGRPEGGRWNYDSENRLTFGKSGPGDVPEPLGFRPDATTKEVLALVNRQLADHPGSLARFDWPVTPRQARRALKDFIANRLSRFGPYEDAMWTGRPCLYHSRLSSALNLKLLDPRDAVAAAVEAYRAGAAPLNSVEGFVRQIIGWREYIRGIYWHFMPDYLELNHFKAVCPLPRFYWTGQTEMNCLREVISQTLSLGFAHHIQRLMVTGLFALLLGVAPEQVHQWYLAIYVDAVEWVELPNVLGMSQFADGGLMSTKPYIATGKYIKRMSNYCAGCRYRPEKRIGEDACPFTTLYWDFLLRHEKLLAANPRTLLQVRNLRRLDATERRKIRRAADAIRGEPGGRG